MKNIDKHYAAVHIGNPAKSFSASEGSEAERRGWDEDTYRLKNQGHTPFPAILPDGMRIHIA